MATIEHPSGLRITLPEGVSLLAEETFLPKRNAARRKVGVVPMRGAADRVPHEAQRVADALVEQDMVLVARLPLSVEPVRGGATRAARKRRDLTVDVELGADESAVVLLERDGYYSWHFDAVEAAMPATDARRGRRSAGRRRTRFQLSLGGEPLGEAKRRGAVSDLLVEHVQALVFKFAGSFLLRRGVAFLERKLRTGLVALDGDDPSAWKPVEDLSALALPEDRPARILLFVHGTFSSTKGAFGALGATPWGRGFLAAAREGYDLVLGFDHPTLSVDPLNNATALLSILEGRSWTLPPVIDAVCHSRGGIMLRSLVEHLLPAAAVPLRLGRVIFVGAVNGGTKLAEPENWRTFIDLYTNVAMAACRAIAMFPQATFAAGLVEELLKSVGALAKVLVARALTAEVIPGLAAMRPSGPFITALNQTQPGQPTAASSRYYAISSEFRAELTLDSLEALPRRLLLALADGAVDRLMGASNDLVVDTASMTHIDPHAGTFIKDALEFGQNGSVHHTCYFVQPRTISALMRWLELGPARPGRAGGTRGLALPGGVRPLDLPERMSTDVLVVLAEDDLREVLAQIDERAPHYVVIEQARPGRTLHYALRTEELRETLRRKVRIPREVSLADSLGLREADASLVGDAGARPEPRSAAGSRSSHRVIALDGGRVVGVGETRVVPSTLAELVAETGRSKPKLRKPPGVDVSFSVGEPAPPALEAGRAERPRSWKGEPPGVGEVMCHFLAEMDDEVCRGEATTVEVRLSREIVRATRAMAAAAAASAQANAKLIVELICKKNFIARGSTREERELPESDVPVEIVFDVEGTDVGEGEILVRIRQGAQPLASLLLRSRIVGRRLEPPVRRPQDVSVLNAAPGPQPLHQLTITEIERGGQKLYHYVLDSPSLRWKHMYESRPLVGSREAYVDRIYEDIESRYRSSASDAKQFTQELRELGAGLWDELFPPELQAALWKHRAAIGSILVFSEEPFIPWELVHLKPPGKGLPRKPLFLGQMGLVRWLHNVGWPTTTLRARQGRCRYVIPRYPHSDYELPEAEAEARFLEERLGATPVDPHAEPVRKLLRTRGSFDVLHFAGHGVAESGDITRAELLLQGRVEAGSYVLEPLRASVVENLSGLVGKDGVQPIVTLNACQAGRAGYKLTSVGGFSRAFLGQGAGMLVAAMWSVYDRPARTFTETLYERMAAGDTLAEATIAAREAAREEDEATWLAYTVYGHPAAKLED
jgi:hypothetical protein